MLGQGRRVRIGDLACESRLIHGLIMERTVGRAVERMHCYHYHGYRIMRIMFLVLSSIFYSFFFFFS
jgi:hypothetical protein